MRLVVLVKCVPDTESKIRIEPDGKSLHEADLKWVVNPYDEYALEEALKIAQARPDSSVTVVSLGDERAQTALRQCLAMGATRAVLLAHAAFQGSDGIATARALAGAARTVGFDLVLAGKQGVGHDNSQVGPMVAELLDVPHVGVVTRVELEEDRLRCRREIEGGSEVVETSLPALVTAQKGLNEPRYASLKGIMAAKKKPIETWGPENISVAPDRLGERGAGVRWTALEPPPPRPPGKLLQGDAKTVVPELVRLLADEAKVI